MLLLFPDIAMKDNYIERTNKNRNLFNKFDQKLYVYLANVVARVYETHYIIIGRLVTRVQISSRTLTHRSTNKQTAKMHENLRICIQLIRVQSMCTHFKFQCVRFFSSMACMCVCVCVFLLFCTIHFYWRWYKSMRT